MGKINCWEFMRCGRGPGGQKTNEPGVCPAATQARAHGIHGGAFGGRACWAIAGTYCGGKVQGTFASKQANCAACKFHKFVGSEEGDNLLSPAQILIRISLPRPV